MKHNTLLAVAISVALTFLTAKPAMVQSRDDRPKPAIEAVLDLFDRYPIVALGMSHRQQDEADFSLALIRDPRFAAKVNDIVVECGNALYQPTLDRYVAGGSVPIEELRLVWRNTTQMAACEARQHKELLDAVREVNRKLPAGKKIRVLAGDSPVDWEKIRSAEDFAPFMMQRDSHFAGVVEREVLAKHHRALLVIGAGHVLKQPISWAALTTPADPTITMLLEKQKPNCVFVIIPHDDFGKRNSELEPKLGDWTNPSLAELSKSWVGELDAGLIFEGKIRRVGSDPNQEENPFPGMKLRDIADGYLYLGPIASIHQVEFPQPDSEYAKELERRMKLLDGGMRQIGAPGPIPVPVPAPTHNR
jgi:hypothetical protein